MEVFLQLFHTTAYFSFQRGIRTARCRSWAVIDVSTYDLYSHSCQPSILSFFLTYSGCHSILLFSYIYSNSMTCGKLQFLSLWAFILLRYSLENVHWIPVVFLAMGRCHLDCTANDLGWKGWWMCVTHSDPLCSYQVYIIWTDANASTLSIIFASCVPSTIFQNEKLWKKKQKKNIRFSKKSKFMSASVFLIFQDKLFVFSFGSFGVMRLPLMNQNLVMDLVY